MGNKISWENAENCGLKNNNDSIFAPPNKYGYKININHPKIRPLYEQHLKKVGERILSDRQRFEFEMEILSSLKNPQKYKYIDIQPSAVNRTDSE